MAQPQVKVMFVDGSVETFPIRPMTTVAAERSFKGSAMDSVVEFGYRTAWKASGARQTFEAWLEGVESIEEFGDETAASADEQVDPTPAPSLDESQPSP